ncbi:MAG TPA: S41 family peptidase [Thermoanaerobaculia bacterium]|jgi:hypothetical protein
MARACALALFLLVVLPVRAIAPAPVNLDFEQGSPGEVPPGWFAPPALGGYSAVLTADAPKQGKQSVRVSGASKTLENGRPSFGNVMQVVDASAYRGKRVRLRGAVRVEGATATAGLWMRVDQTDGKVGFFDNMDDRPIRSAEWAYYEITGEVAPNAELLNFGMLMQQEGTAWLDDVTLEIVGTVTVLPARSAPPRAVTPRGMENLAAFARLFGIVRHFHASDEAAAADWEAVAVNGSEVVEGAKNAEELAARLTDVFLPLAPSLKIVAGSAAPEAKLAPPEGAREIVAWEHHGYGQKDARSRYSSNRVRRGLDATDGRYPHPSEPFRIDLGGGVSASLPLAVFADATGTLPRATRQALPAPTGTSYSGNDRASRIGAVVILWNVMQHFYPYFDVVDADWAAELRPALRAAATDRGEEAFLVTLRRLVAALDDGHGSVQLLSAAARAPLPLFWRVVGDKLVVVTVDPAVSGVSAGDEVVAIDGRPAFQALREAEALISSPTPQWRRWRGLFELSSGPVGSRVVLTIRAADGTTRPVTLTRAARTQPMREKRPEKIAELQPGLWYVDLDRASDADFAAAVEKLGAARGIVFDLRGYPRLDTKPLQHLIDSPVESARWNVPIVRRPGLAGAEWSTSGRWSLEPLQPRFTKNVVFLIDGRAISYAESWMGIVEAYKLATIVGETTAGTNGNVNTVQLPGGYRVHFTGMKVLKHDGSRHHGVGIVPTVPVTPTIAGIRAGRDEVLEKALELLSK